MGASSSTSSTRASAPPPTGGSVSFCALTRGREGGAAEDAVDGGVPQGLSPAHLGLSTFLAEWVGQFALTCPSRPQKSHVGVRVFVPAFDSIDCTRRDTPSSFDAISETRESRAAELESIFPVRVRRSSVTSVIPPEDTDEPTIDEPPELDEPPVIDPLEAKSPKVFGIV